MSKATHTHEFVTNCQNTVSSVDPIYFRVSASALVTVAVEFLIQFKRAEFNSEFTEFVVRCTFVPNAMYHRSQVTGLSVTFNRRVSERSSYAQLKAVFSKDAQLRWLVYFPTSDNAQETNDGTSTVCARHSTFFCLGSPLSIVHTTLAWHGNEAVTHRQQTNYRLKIGNLLRRLTYGSYLWP